MTAYNIINSSETDPDEPLTSFLAKRWTDNWIAGFEGQPTAPKLLARAIKPVSWGTVFKFDNNPAGSVIIAGQSSTVRSRVGVMNFGSVDFYIETSVGVGSGSFTMNRLRAGTTTQLLATGSLGNHGNTARNVLVSIQPGDQLEVVVVGGSASNNNAAVNRVAIRTSGDDLWVSESMMGNILNAYAIP